MPVSPASSTAAASAISWLRPPFPLPLIVTVVSPPATMQAGGAIGLPVCRASRAMQASKRPASLASPASDVVSRSGAYPSDAAFRMAASTASPFDATREIACLPGRLFGVSGMRPATPSPMRRMTEPGTLSMSEYRSSTSCASANVVESGTVGPEPMNSRRSPTTSEMRRLTTRPFARAARRPPLMSLRCLRTVLISRMFAPHSSMSFVVSILSPRLRGGDGRGRRLELPPESRKRQRSLSSMLSTSWTIRRAAARPFESGTGWPLEMISIRGPPASRG